MSNNRQSNAVRNDRPFDWRKEVVSLVDSGPQNAWDIPTGYILAEKGKTLLVLKYLGESSLELLKKVKIILKDHTVFMKTKRNNEENSEFLVVIWSKEPDSKQCWKLAAQEARGWL